MTGVAHSAGASGAASDSRCAWRRCPGSAGPRADAARRSACSRSTAAPVASVRPSRDAAARSAWRCSAPRAARAGSSARGSARRSLATRTYTPALDGRTGDAAMTTLTTLADAEAASRRAAAEIARELTQARTQRGSAHVALSGGGTPARTYELLAAASLTLRRDRGCGSSTSTLRGPRGRAEQLHCWPRAR